MKNSVLVIAAHPDDEIIGCGGTIAKHREKNDIVNVLIVAEGETSRKSERKLSESKEKLKKLKEDANKANKILGTSELRILNYPDNRLDSIDRLDLIKVIENHIKELNPNIIYTHYPWDLNIDHRRIHESVITACRPIPNQKITQIYCFEIASSTEWQSPCVYPNFSPNYYVDITLQKEQKLAALREYRSEMREWPHSRSVKSIENLFRLRGSQVGLEAAEAFMLIRQIA